MASPPQTSAPATETPTASHAHHFPHARSHAAGQEASRPASWTRPCWAARMGLHEVAWACMGLHEGWALLALAALGEGETRPRRTHRAHGQRLHGRMGAWVHCRWVILSPETCADLSTVMVATRTLEKCMY